MIEPAIPRTSTQGFLFADLRDYSAFVEENGDLAAADLLASYRTLMRSVVGAFEGAEVRTEGDSFYVVFPSASSAVRGGMAALDAAADNVPALRIGVGVHAGETAQTGEGPVGSAVNIAARVCARAGAGELIVTDTVRTLTRTLVPFRFVPRGTPELKGIGEPIALFRVAKPDDPEVVAVDAARRRTARAAGERTPHGAGHTGARSAGTRRRIAAVAGLGAMALVVAVALIVLPSRPVGQGERTLPPAPSATQSSPSPSLSAPQADLIARLPLVLRPTCVPSTKEAIASGATASVTCTPAAGGPTSVTYGYFAQLSSLLATYDSYLTAHGIFGGDCRTTSTASGVWTVGPTFSGHVLCYLESKERPVLIWTYESGDGQGLLAEAYREDGDSAALYAWWEDIRVFVTH